MRRLNKKGAEMTIGTLVVIVLAIIVLVVIALGFGTGWSNLWSKITGYFGGGSNVDSIKQACSYACTTQATYDYCCAVREVKYAKDGVATRLTCDSEGLMGKGKCENTKCDGANANVCAGVTCLATDGTVELKTACPEDRRDASKTLNANGVPIAATDVCCKAAAVAKVKCVGAAPNLEGSWEIPVNNACPDKTGKTKADLTSQVTDTTEATANVGKKCCKYTS